MTNVYLDRLRDERQSINNVAKGMPGVGQSQEVKVGLLVVEAITNLADTIQTIHEAGGINVAVLPGEGSDQA